MHLGMGSQKLNEEKRTVLSLSWTCPRRLGNVSYHQLCGKKSLRTNYCVVNVRESRVRRRLLGPVDGGKRAGGGERDIYRSMRLNGRAGGVSVGLVVAWASHGVTREMSTRPLLRADASGPRVFGIGVQYY